MSAAGLLPVIQQQTMTVGNMLTFMLMRLSSANNILMEAAASGSGDANSPPVHLHIQETDVSGMVLVELLWMQQLCESLQCQRIHNGLCKKLDYAMSHSMLCPCLLYVGMASNYMWHLQYAKRQQQVAVRSWTTWLTMNTLKLEVGNCQQL